MSTAAAALVCFAVEDLGAATPDTAPNVIYMASGTFASPPVSGSDQFRLQGQPFSISVMANAATVPKVHGQQWAQYNDLRMQGTVQSGLLPTPIAISNNLTDILLATGNPDHDLFMLGSPIKVAGITVQIQATITMPKGTIPNAHIHPFTAPVALGTPDATMTYSYSGSSTTLAIESGTLNAKLQGTTTAMAPALYEGGAQVITVQPGGGQMARPLRGAPVNLGAAAGTVILRFYASGVRDASVVDVRIADEEVPVLYAGASGYFQGLDEVSVQVPPDLAGRGAAGVVLTADGHTAWPVHIQIQ